MLSGKKKEGSCIKSVGENRVNQPRIREIAASEAFECITLSNRRETEA
jgi:hypothetical protein